jgi:hypothetical protein
MHEPQNHGIALVATIDLHSCMHKKVITSHFIVRKQKGAPSIIGVGHAKQPTKSDLEPGITNSASFIMQAELSFLYLSGFQQMVLSVN